MNVDDQSVILVTCAPYLVELLAAEVKSLGYRIRSQHRTSIVLRGSWRDAMRLNLRLRTALSVHYLLKEFRARTPERLYNKASTIEWESLISPDETVTVTSHVDTPSVNHSAFPSLKVKDAIVDRIAQHCGARPDSGSERKGVVVSVYWKDDLVRIYANTSGTRLSDRGYRRMPHTAPMQETLAAGVLMACGYDGTMPLVNPMCGAGTVAIEAALIAAGRAPGLLRLDFGLLHLKDVDREAWEAERREAKRGRRTDTPPIIATDNDPRAMDAAKRNAITAGVDHLIQFDLCDFMETPLPDDPGIVFLNPEYGRRLGDASGLEPTYKRIGDFFKQRCAGWSGRVFTGNMDLAKKIGLRASARRPFMNAEVECRLLTFEVYEGSRR